MIGATTGCTWCDSNYPAHAIGNDLFHMHGGDAHVCAQGEGAMQVTKLDRAIVVFGPQGSGKTHTAARIAAKYGADRIIDEWDGVSDLAPGDLALTTVMPPYKRPAYQKPYRTFSIAEFLIPPSRQQAVLAWALENFGPVAGHREERAARMVEEAIEAAQACGLAQDMVHRIATRVYGRPTGTLAQEIGGLAITLDALAEIAGLDVQAEADREWTRVKSLPREWWQRKHAEKVTAGTANLRAA